MVVVEGEKASPATTMGAGGGGGDGVPFAGQVGWGATPPSCEPASTVQCGDAWHTQSGYLLKMGSNLRRMKRRFFAIKPMSLLFYYLSEFDEEPRGCINIDQYHDINRDGKRVELSYPGCSEEDLIILEAKSCEEALAWEKALQFSQFKAILAKCETERSEREALEVEKERAQSEVATLQQYAEQRHVTALALQSEREQRKELVDALSRLSDSMRSVAVARGISSSLQLSAARMDDDGQETGLQAIEYSISFVNRVREELDTGREALRSEQEARREAEARILELEVKLLGVQKAAGAASDAELEVRGRASVLESQVGYLEKEKSRLESDVARFKLKISTLKREKAVMLQGLREMRNGSAASSSSAAAGEERGERAQQNCPSLGLDGLKDMTEANNRTGTCVDSPAAVHHNGLDCEFDEGQVKPPYNSLPSIAADIQQLLQPTSEGFRYNSATFRNLVRQGIQARSRPRCGILPHVNDDGSGDRIGSTAQSPHPRPRPHSSTLSPALITAKDLECEPDELEPVPALTSPLQPSVNQVEYEIKFFDDRIGLQFTVNECGQLLVSGYKGFSGPADERPALGSILVAYNGIFIRSTGYQEACEGLRQAGRPLTLRFAEVLSEDEEESPGGQEAAEVAAYDMFNTIRALGF
jgi:hypothetical protein